MVNKDIRKNYLNIQGWMVQDLELKGNELLVYSLIFGFCQDKDSEFTGSVSYICTWLSCSKNTALSCLKSLIKKGLIKKDVDKKNGLIFNHYKVDFSKIDKNCTGGAKIARGVQKQYNRGAKITLGGGAKIEPNNIINNKDNNKDIYSGYLLFSSTDFTDSYNGFKQMRKLIKSPLTDRAEKIILNKITKLSGGDVDKAVTILDQSTQNSWKDIYELKSNQQVISKNQPKSSTPTEKRKFTY